MAQTTAMIKCHNLKHKRSLLSSVENSIPLKHVIQLKEKANMLILSNGLLLFVSHVPEFGVTLFLLVYVNEMSEYCLNFLSCNELIIEMAHSFNFFTVAFQFFIYKKFDKNFSESFSNLLER